MSPGRIQIRPLGGGPGCLLMILFSIVASVVLTVVLNLLARAYGWTEAEILAVFEAVEQGHLIDEDGAEGESKAMVGAKSLVDNLKSMLAKPKAKAA